MTQLLRERLRGALTQQVRKEPAGIAAAVTELADLSALGGRWFGTPDGPGYVVESRYEAGHLHGRIPLHAALAVDLGQLSRQAKAPALAASDVASLLYFDTETTGMGGAGSMVFLCGVARFEGGYLRLRQYLLPGPQYEGGLLGGVSGELETASALVSYNGKSFDVPQLEARAVLSRRTLDLRRLPHLDLLHPNRRLFRGMFSSHRLPEMEQELLGFAREDDCPSHEAPERYFRFQRSGDPTHIAPVLRHNAWDILSLVALTAHLAGTCAGEAGPLQASRAAEYAGDYARARDYALQAAGNTSARAARLEAMERAARSCARLGDWAQAADWWRQLIDDPRGRKVVPFVELAKLYEHRTKDVPAALAVVDRALALLERGLIRPGPVTSESSREALERRRVRLSRRVAAPPPKV